MFQAFAAVLLRSLFFLDNQQHGITSQTETSHVIYL